MVSAEQAFGIGRRRDKDRERAQPRPLVDAAALKPLARQMALRQAHRRFILPGERRRPLNGDIAARQHEISCYDNKILNLQHIWR